MSADGLTYREFGPPPGLEGIVECFWRRECWRPPNHDLGVLPDGRMDLIWDTDGDMLVMGPQTQPLGRPLPPDAVVVGVRFPPGVGPALLGVPAYQLTNMHVALESVDAKLAVSLLRDLVTIEDAAAAPARIARAVVRRFDEHGSLDLAVRRAAALLKNPGARVHRIADTLALSERQLQRRFRRAVGYGPKTLQRVLRFQRLLETLALDRAEADGLAGIAAAVGYSDQAHLTREARELSGLSPVRLADNLDTLRAGGASGIFKTGRPARSSVYPARS
jgi:AraC-like DNA-binding protein